MPDSDGTSSGQTGQGPHTTASAAPGGSSGITLESIMVAMQQQFTNSNDRMQQMQLDLSAATQQQTAAVQQQFSLVNDQLQEQSQETRQQSDRHKGDIDRISARVDQLSLMFTDMNTNLAPHRSLPNIPGWMPSSGNAIAHAPAAAAAVTSTTPAPLPTTIPLALHSAVGPGGTLQPAPTYAQGAGLMAPSTMTAPIMSHTVSAPAGNHATPAHPAISGLAARPNMHRPQNPAPARSLGSNPSSPMHSPLLASHFCAPFGSMPQPMGPQPPPRSASWQPLPPFANAVTTLGAAGGEPQAPSRASAPQTQGRGRGRGRVQARQPRDESSIDDEEYDDDDGYAVNRETDEVYCKTLSMDKFSSENKEQEFSIWVQQFEDAVNRGTNPHCKEHHHLDCLKWLPTLLKANAYAIWQRSEHRKENWPELKLELDRAFEDPTIRAEWRSNMKAYLWDEGKVSLQSYAAKVKRYVDKYEIEMAGCDAAVKYQYYLRFVNGLPEDYAEHVGMSMPSNCHDVNKALDVCVRWQAIKKKKKRKYKDIRPGTDEDPTTPSLNY